MSLVVGISAHYHDAACALFRDGRLVAAVQEERFTRRRYDPSTPVYAFRHCLDAARANPEDIDVLAYYETPQLKLERQLFSMLPDVPSAHPATLFRLDPTRAERQIRDLLGYEGAVVTVPHHVSHAASAHYLSGWEESATFVADAVGEWATTSYGSAGPDGIRIIEEVHFPSSLGIFYSAVTSLLGFAVNSDEYKVMGLAAYGRPRFVDRMRTFLQDQPGGQFRLDTRYVELRPGRPIVNEALQDLVGVARRRSGDPITADHEDLACSAQAVLEEVLRGKLRHLHDRIGASRLSYAGGVALNCLANGRLLPESPFSEWFIQPAAGDAGGAVGAAAHVSHTLCRDRPGERLLDARLGPAFTTADVQQVLGGSTVPYAAYPGDEDALVRDVAARLSRGQIVGWFQGSMEFGPRALGARSILADPRDPGTQDALNLRVKKREPFRPFAPAVPLDDAPDYFDLAGESPFMLMTGMVLDPGLLPAITHVDGSARVQTVTERSNRRLYRLLKAFGEITGVPVLLNTSMNVAGEPIACTPSDALACFVRAGLDALAAEDVVVDRRAVPQRWMEDVQLSVPFRPSAVPTDTYSFL